MEDPRRTHDAHYSFLARCAELVWEKNSQMLLALDTDIGLKSEELAGINGDIETLTREQRDLAGTLPGLQVLYSDTLAQLNTEIALETAEIEVLEQELQGLLGKSAEGALEHQSLLQAKSRIKVETDRKKIESEQAQAAAEDARSHIVALNSSIATLDLETSTLASNKLQLHQATKSLNNELQELKGNIRVFCRVRPPTDSAAPSGLEVTDHEVHLKQQGKSLSFYFDRVFPPESSQEYVFREVSQLIQSALDGYNVCIFAYGQTGSGKTYTMEGPKGSDLVLEEDESFPDKGIIQRSMEQLFASREALKALAWEFSFTASFIEIYNENIRDLLENSKKITAFSAAMIQPTTVLVDTYAELLPLLATARHQRIQAQTHCNAHSSRSHCLFQLRILGQREDERSTGTLNIIDLAGSERLKVSKAQGERLEETKAINKSLSALRDVIQALARREKHIPFRNSKLTALLQNCLGGAGKTLMFVNIAPENLHETVYSLRFAQQVTTCTVVGN